MTGQEKEISTIKERGFTLSLSDADVKRLYEKVAESGITVSALLENFVGDLVDGTYSNGSDERMLANQWFERCGFRMFSKKTFLSYLLEEGTFEYFLSSLENLESAEENINIAKAEMTCGKAMGRGGTLYPWKEIVDSEGKPAYASREAWDRAQEDFVDQEEEIAESYREDIKEIWISFLKWADLDPKTVYLETEIPKLKEWKNELDKQLLGKTDIAPNR